jgi:hypothetical protein
MYVRRGEKGKEKPWNCRSTMALARKDIETMHQTLYNQYFCT